MSVRADVDRGLAIRDEVEKLGAELKAINKRLQQAALAGEQVDLNDADREGLRQMLSSLRKDPMEVEDDPDNNDGSFFPCEFCGDPYPSEFIMRHQV